MNSKFNFDKISLLDTGGIFLERWVISADLIGGDGSRESKAFEDGFFIINFGKFFVDKAVTPEAKFKDLTSDGYLFDKFGKNLWVITKVQLATLAAAWYF